jgi:hypothetical protein
MADRTGMCSDKTEVHYASYRKKSPAPFGVTDPTLKFMRQKSHCKLSHSERFLD